MRGRLQKRSTFWPTNRTLLPGYRFAHPGDPCYSSSVRLEDHIEGRLGGAAEALETRFSRNLAQSAFPRLRT
jgi:hypothetical protein